MKIAEFGTLQMVRTDKAHFGQRNIQPAVQSGQSKSFQSYLLDALSTVNNQQMDVTAVQEKLITDPDDVDIHDVTIAMAKARQSLNLAQTVIDRLVSGWNEITTTR